MECLLSIFHWKSLPPINSCVKILAFLLFLLLRHLHHQRGFAQSAMSRKVLFTMPVGRERQVREARFPKISQKKSRKYAPILICPLLLDSAFPVEKQPMQY